MEENNNPNIISVEESKKLQLGEPFNKDYQIKHPSIIEEYVVVAAVKPSEKKEPEKRRPQPEYVKKTKLSLTVQRLMPFEIYSKIIGDYDLSQVYFEHKTKKEKSEKNKKRNKNVYTDYSRFPVYKAEHLIKYLENKEEIFDIFSIEDSEVPIPINIKDKTLENLMTIVEEEVKNHDDPYFRPPYIILIGKHSHKTYSDIERVNTQLKKHYNVIELYTRKENIIHPDIIEQYNKAFGKRTAKKD